MPDYAALLLPSANRVYAEAARGLLRAELEVANHTVLGGQVRGLAETDIGGLRYLTFGCDDELGPAEISVLSALSSLYALFAREGDRLRPVELPQLQRFDDDLVTIPKYSGKTNEQFTKLMLNVTLLSSASAPRMAAGRLCVLDPLCGRGTTLNQALLDGHDATGVDADQRAFDAYVRFLRTWLKHKRLPHRAGTTPLRENRERLGTRFDVTIGRTREAYKAGDVARVTMLCADTRRVPQVFARQSFDAAVADLPYGVQHGSRGRDQRLSRNPLELVKDSLPGWVEVLRPGAALGLAWNTHLAKRAELAQALESQGLAVCDAPPYRGFTHRVDQAIVRDLIVARKP